MLAECDVALILHEEAATPLGGIDFADAGRVALVVGPEGGISADELASFASARTVKLGSSVLRTSTAGVAAVAALLSRTERWS